MLYILSEEELIKLNKGSVPNIVYAHRNDKPMYTYMLISLVPLRVPMIKITALNFKAVREYLGLKYKIMLKTNDFTSKLYPLNSGKYGKMWEFVWQGMPFQIYKLRKS